MSDERQITDSAIRRALVPADLAAPAGLFEDIATAVRATPQRRPSLLGRLLPAVDLPIGGILSPGAQRYGTLLATAALLSLALLGLALVAAALRDELPSNGLVSWLAPDGRLRLIDPATGEQSLPLGDEPAVEGFWSSAFDRLAVADPTSGLVLYDTAGRETGSIPVPSPELLLDGTLTWAPDDRRIALVASERGLPRILIADLDAGTMEPLDLGMPAYGPSWSPDGRWLAFSGSPGYGLEDQGIYVVRLDGTDVLRVGTGSPAGVKEVATSLPHAIGGVSWFPGSDRVAFDTYAISQKVGAIWAVNVDGTELTRLTPPSQAGWYPVVSPDGRYIAFHGESEHGCRDDLWVMAADGSGARMIRERSWIVTWSPDGTRLLAITAPSPAGMSLGDGVVSLRPDGSDARLLVPFGTAGLVNQRPPDRPHDTCWMPEFGLLGWRTDRR
jgi:hypothetical protein